ncbi:hypothetical protein LX32DRAFT_691955 [Colletotrichum zoysiae]|uniref:Uncharacterized protein n=1 Tax=Colletotrichum zoysiae TaxID=1216348 RepID=A0AAD9HN95_9PEZI|nr:hypothetical protein LX32DRAFT_691955 [Colletotrichum zoysiae]
MFIPTRGFAEPAVSLSQHTNGPPAEYAALLENVHLFSQLDWIVVSLASIVFAHLLLSRRDGVDGGKVSGEASTPTEAQETIYRAAAAVFLGSGAAGSFALAIRETRLP